MSALRWSQQGKSFFFRKRWSKKFPTTFYFRQGLVRKWKNSDSWIFLQVTLINSCLKRQRKLITIVTVTVAIFWVVELNWKCPSLSLLTWLKSIFDQRKVWCNEFDKSGLFKRSWILPKLDLIEVWWFRDNLPRVLGFCDIAVSV